MSFAQLVQGKIVLLHAYYVPVVAADAAIIAVSPVEIREAAENNLLAMKASLQEKHGIDVPIDCYCAEGFAIEEINRYTDEHPVDLIVMGMQGAGFLAEKLIGSIATVALRRCKRPVMVINVGVKFSPIRRIALAWDYQPIKHVALEALRTIATAFDAHVYVLHVKRETRGQEEPACALGFNYSLQSVRHSFQVIEDEDVTEGLRNAISREEIDLLVTVPRAHSFFDRLFHETQSKKIAFRAQVPVLALHDI